MEVGYFLTELHHRDCAARDLVDSQSPVCCLRALQEREHDTDSSSNCLLQSQTT
jgi:hypothetical protein